MTQQSRIEVPKGLRRGAGGGEKTEGGGISAWGTGLPCANCETTRTRPRSSSTLKALSPPAYDGSKLLEGILAAGRLALGAFSGVGCFSACVESRACQFCELSL